MTPEEIYEYLNSNVHKRLRHDVLELYYGKSWLGNYGLYILDKCIYDSENIIVKYVFDCNYNIYDWNVDERLRFIDLKKDYNVLDLYYYMLNGFEN